MKKISNKFHQEALTIKIFAGIFAGMACKLKLEKVGTTFSRFSPCPSLSFVTTDNRKQFQCLNIDLNNKTGPLFFEFNSVM